MAIPKIEKLSYADLLELQSHVHSMIDQRRAEDQAKIRAMAGELAAEAGFSLEEIVANGRARGGGKRKYVKVAIKYRNPKNPSQTWTGRGRRPKWLVAELEKGRSREAFLVR